MIIRTDILIMSILHTEPLRDHAKLGKSKSLIKMSCRNIAGHNRIKLQDTKTMLFSPGQTVGYQLFSNVKSSGISAYRIAGVTDMTASSDIIRMKNVKSVNFSAFRIYCCSSEKKAFPVSSLRHSSCGKATPSSTTSFHIRIRSGRSFSSYFLTVTFMMIFSSI